MAEMIVICESETFDSFAIGQNVRHKVLALHIVDLTCHVKWYTLVWWTINIHAAAHRVSIFVEQVATFLIYRRKLLAQQIIYATEVEPAAKVGNVNDMNIQFTREMIEKFWIMVTVSV